MKSPSYYTRGSIEVWDFVRDQDLNYHLGCAIKYICRAGYKNDRADDLHKAIHYLENELQHELSRGVPTRLQSPEFDPPTTVYTEDFDR
jgi:hypothetical protein